MTPPVKKSKPSWLLYLLIAVFIGILLCGGVILYLTVFRTTIGDGPDELYMENVTTTTDGTTSTTTIMTTSEAPTTTTIGSTTPKPSTTTLTTTTTTSTTMRPEIGLPIDIASILKEQQEEYSIVEKCASIQVLPVSCSPTKSSPSTLQPSQFKPIHYNLNMTIRDVRKPIFEGYQQSFAKSYETTQGIAMHAAKIHNLESGRINVVNCDTGETLCVTRVQLINDIAVIETAQTIEPNTNLRIDMNGFISADSGSHVYKQIPTAKWRVPTMVGTVFEPTSARYVFPSFDNHDQKATMSLCLNHGPTMTAISNSEVVANRSSSTVSCFEKSVPLTAQQTTFVSFEKTSTIFYNRTTLNGVYLPEVELIVNLNNNFKQQHYEWIYNETAQVMALLAKYTGFSFPLNRLSMVVAPVQQGHTALGVITLPAQAVAYQKHTTTHETLIKEVIGQWMEGVVTTEHTCFEKALIAYLEWKVNEELQIVKKTRKAEIQRIRPRNLNETTDQLRVIRSLKSSGLCSPRFVEAFYTLDETFGQDTVIGMIRVIFDKFAFSTASISDWAAAASVATGREEAGALISEWYTREDRPVVKATVTSQSVEFQQLTNETWTIPLEIAGSNGVQLAVINQMKQVVPFVSTDYVVVDPARKNHAFVVYDADTYLRLIRCFGDSRCPSKEIGGVFSDLAAALIANILPKPENVDVAKWKSVFKFMAQQNLVEGTAACCVEHAIREMRKCTYWDIQDVCTKIEFNTVLAAVA